LPNSLEYFPSFNRYYVSFTVVESIHRQLIID